jgi:flagellar protein FlgJ
MGGTFPPDVIAGAVTSHKAYPTCLASLSLAQWAVESGWGAKSPGNNPFGIKHMVGYPDQTFHTHEEVNGVMIPEDLVFAKFPTIADAFTAHAALIATRPQYAPAIALLPDVEAYVTALAHVYATASNYAATLLSIIHAHNLTQYDGE